MAESSKDKNLPALSRTRKILIVIFMIGFWLIFYWHKGSQPPSAPDIPDPSQSATPSEKQDRKK